MTQSGVSKAVRTCLRSVGQFWSLMLHQGQGVLWVALGPLDTSSFGGRGSPGPISVNAWERTMPSVPAGKEPIIVLRVVVLNKQSRKKCLYD